MAFLTDLPSEIVDAIADWIDSGHDALAFALTAKAICPVLSPRHTQLRKWSCSPDADCAWATLARDATLARNIRILEVDTFPDLHHTFICRIADPQNPNRAESIRLLVLALRNMHNLIAFRFDVMHREVSEVAYEQGMWEALVASCPNVTELYIREVARTTGWERAVYTMSNLTVFEYSAFEGMYEASMDCTRLGKMLRERCPNLQKLRIRVDDPSDPLPPDIGESILTGHWSHLTSFHMQDVVRCTPEAIVSFLSAHPGLRELHLDGLMGSDELGCEVPLSCPSGLLPGLVTMASTPGHIVDILSSRAATSTHLKEIWVLYSETQESRCEEFRTFAKSHLQDVTIKG
ncbi:hypothetical protein BV25DRAFT_1840736 [Artomyces pyxidatus]|uniref:Uncharacterized protein n=1 Tax=Artomyces pyxidatus TaxID=48021 RepID=A0ACB8SRS8_9AGAM|nr:hypothetical protein BV25DRAFT_1840736 [Artomyces pyxidatus]